MERHCCSTHDQDNTSSSLSHLLDHVNDFLFPPTPLVDPKPLTDDDLHEWLAEIDRSKRSTDCMFAPANELNTPDGSSSPSFPAAPTNSSIKCPLSPVKKKKRDYGAHSSQERVRGLNRRARINERIEILKKLVPTSHENDSMAMLLDKTIDHIRQLHETNKMMCPTFSASRSAVPANRDVQLSGPFAFQPMAFVPVPMQTMVQMMDIKQGSSFNSNTVPFLSCQGITPPFFYT